MSGTHRGPQPGDDPGAARGGAGVLLSADALNPYHLLGYAVYEELPCLNQAGLSPHEALRAGTHDAALALDKLDEFGAMAVGKRAGLPLQDADPPATIQIELRPAWWPQPRVGRCVSNGSGAILAFERISFWWGSRPARRASN